MSHVPVLGIMTFLHGLGMTLIGSLALGGALFTSVSTMHQFLSNQDFSMADLVIGVILMAMSLVLTLAGLAQGLAGLLLRRWRGRAWASLSWHLGLVGIFTLYQAPTSIALLIWGRRVLRDPEVQKAFLHPESQDSTSLRDELA